MTRGNYDIYDRTFKFSLDVIRFINTLPRKPATFALSDQIIRSACSIGANLREAKQARTKKEFISSFGVSLKEAEESIYWLNLVEQSGLTDTEESAKLIQEYTEIVKILTTIIKKSKSC